MAQIFFRICQERDLCIETVALSLKDVVDEYFSGAQNDFFIVSGCRVVSLNSPVQNGAKYHLVPRVLGGKGGFGSMLRAIGAQIDKTKSREACRDLSGRRMRDINNEKKLRDWVGKRAEREREKEERRKVRMERLKAGPRHTFDDPEYMEQKSQVSDRLLDALEHGLQKMHKKGNECGQKRRAESDAAGTSTKKRTAEWVGFEGMDDLSDLDSDSSDDLTEEEKVTLAAVISEYQQLQQLPDNSLNSSAGEVSHIDEAAVTQSSTTDAGQLSYNENEKADEIHHDTDSNSCSMNTTDTSEYVMSSSEKDKTVKESSATVSNIENHSSEATTFSQTQRPVEAYSTNAPEKQNKQEECVDLEQYDRANELEVLGLDALKSALMTRGLKCGGTLEERAVRLFSVRGLSPEQYDPALLAKGKGKSGKGKKNK